MCRKTMLPLAAAVLVSLAGMALPAQAKGSAPGGDAANVAKPQLVRSQADYLNGSGPLTPAQRGQIARDFVKRWGPYFQRTSGEPMNRWAIKQAQVIGRADPDNLRSAMRKQTLDAASLAMRGLELSDAQAIDQIIFKMNQSGEPSAPLALGDVAADLVFTPLAPCRVFDTRSAGPILPNGGTRSFDTFPWTGGNFSYQGGTAAGNCGLPADVAAIALNIAAPLSVASGFLTVYPYGTVRPLASHLDYTTGELKNNGIVAVSANSTFDITVYAHGSTHVVGDVVGYFIRPAATALSCVDTAETIVNVAAGATANAVAPVCAATYTQTATNCESSTWQMPFVYFSGGTCSAQNNSAGAASLRASRTCCRVPGR